MQLFSIEESLSEGQEILYNVLRRDEEEHERQLARMWYQLEADENLQPFHYGYFTKV